MKISSKELPAYVRRCYEAAKKANSDNRKAEIERLKFYAGGELQWHEGEVSKRKAGNRPIVTINKCKPAVDQIEGDIRLNPPGPQCHPVGDQADDDTADIIEGLIREVEYRSVARTAYATAGKYVGASGYACMELATEYAGERTFDQQLRILSVEDPSTVFFDPTSRMANRQDASWAGKIKMYSKQDYIAQFGANRAVLKDRMGQKLGGWIQDAFGYDGSLAQINEWTGGGTLGKPGEGPFFVCEFYMVNTEKKTLTMYEDNVARYEDETAPRGVEPKEGPEWTRDVPVRTITKHLVDALEELTDDTEWLGDIIPLFPVLGPEVYIEGKLHRLSLIAPAMDSQRALNYVATTACEMAGTMPKSPWLGPAGTFDDPRWQSANSEVYAYLEYKPVYVTSPTTGAQELAPPPTRNIWEAPIQWLLALGQWFSDNIKATTAIYDPSLGQQKGDQSGKAIEQLRSESSVGNYSYSDNLHRAIEVMYGQIVLISQKLLSGAQAVTIVKPNSEHEIVQINQDFSKTDGKDPKTGKEGKANNITLGRYSVRVMVGPDFQTRQEETIAKMIDFLKSDPTILQAPGVAAQFVRWIGQGNPQVEHMADLLTPGGEEDQSPEQVQAQLQQSKMQVQQMQQIIQKLAMEKAAKLPEIEAKKYIAEIQALAGIREAEIKAGIDKAEQDISHLETLAGFAHEAAMQAVDHSQESTMADKQAVAASAQSAQDAAQTQAQQEPDGGGE